jgi:hypothetical protein
MLRCESTTPFGLAGAARGIEDGRHVAVDDPVAALLAGLQQRVPVQPGERTAAVGKRIGVDQNHVPQIMAGGQGRRQQGQSLGRSDQRPDIAVAQDVGDLIGFQQGVERDKDAAGRARTKTGDHGFETLLEVDGDPLAALQRAAGRVISSGSRVAAVIS